MLFSEDTELKFIKDILKLELELARKKGHDYKAYIIENRLKAIEKQENTTS